MLISLNVVAQKRHSTHRRSLIDRPGALVGRRQLTTIRPHIPVQTPFEMLPWIVQ